MREEITDVEKGEVVFGTDLFVDTKAGLLGPRTGQDGLAYTTFVI